MNSLQKGSEKHPETLSGSSNWTVNLRKIQVRDSRVVYKENEYEPVDYGINWTDIECRQVNVDITEPDFSGGKFAVRISGLSLEEKSGFGIRDMGGLVTAADSNLLIQECKIYTERSFLDLENWNSIGFPVVGIGGILQPKCNNTTVWEIPRSVLLI